jgi:hypothetical protein
MQLPTQENKDSYFLSFNLKGTLLYTQKSVSLGFSSTVDGCMEKSVGGRKRLHKPANQCFQMWIQL